MTTSLMFRQGPRPHTSQKKLNWAFELTRASVADAVVDSVEVADVESEELELELELEPTLFTLMVLMLALHWSVQESSKRQRRPATTMRLPSTATTQHEEQCTKRGRQLTVLGIAVRHSKVLAAVVGRLGAGVLLVVARPAGRGRQVGEGIAGDPEGPRRVGRLDDLSTNTHTQGQRVWAWEGNKTSSGGGAYSISLDPAQRAREDLQVLGLPRQQECAGVEEAAPDVVHQGRPGCGGRAGGE